MLLVWTYAAGLTVPTSVCLTIAAMVIGVVAMVTHGGIASRRSQFAGNATAP